MFINRWEPLIGWWPIENGELSKLKSGSLIPKMSVFTLAISCLTTSNFPGFQENIPGSYAILLFIALDFTSITSHIHNWVLFLLFILPGVISPLISSSILGTYWPGEFLFQYPIILPFHTVHGVLKARILKWLAIPFSSGPCFVRTLHYDPSVLVWPYMALLKVSLS